MMVDKQDLSALLRSTNGRASVFSPKLDVVEDENAPFCLATGKEVGIFFEERGERGEEQVDFVFKQTVPPFCLSFGRVRRSDKHVRRPSSWLIPIQPFLSSFSQIFLLILSRRSSIKT